MKTGPTEGFRIVAEGRLSQNCDGRDRHGCISNLIWPLNVERWRVLNSMQCTYVKV